MRRLWSYLAPSPLRGLNLAREPGALLLREQNDALTWLSFNGEVKARWPAPSTLAAATIADDGSGAVAAGAAGQVWFFGPDLKPRWQKSIPGKALACALEPLGRLLAISDSTGGVHFFNALGREVGRTKNARPLLHLVFVSERELLLGCAEFGSVVALTAAGKVRWHDAPVAHCGSLATTGDGQTIALACFSEGLVCYGPRGDKQKTPPPVGPCRLAVLSYDGALVLTAGLDGVVRLHGRDGAKRDEWKPEGSVVALALDALGTVAYIGLADGTVTALDVK